MFTLKKFGFLVMSLVICMSSATAADDSARRQCVRDCQSVKDSDLKACEKESGDKLSRCRESARKDYEMCSDRCDKKFPIQLKKSERTMLSPLAACSSTSLPRKKLWEM